MTNEYEVAAVIELGEAHDVVLGEKRQRNDVDSVTLEPGTFIDPIT
jgi:hypothetical protein